MDQSLTGTDGYELDLYVDGLLDAEAQTRFEARLAKDPKLAGELAVQRDLEIRLARSFTPPENAGLAAVKRVSGTRANSRSTARRLLVAALVIVVAGVFARGYFRGSSETSTPEEGGLEVSTHVAGTGAESMAGLGDIYREVTNPNDPFRNDPLIGACKTDSVLGPFMAKGAESSFWIREDPALPVVPTEQGCQLVPGATTFVVPLSPEPIALVALASNVQLPAPEPGDALRVFQRVLGGLVVYEITPYEESRCLDLIMDKTPSLLPDPHIKD